MIKTIIFDMYGVIIEESKGVFIPFVQRHFPERSRKEIINLFSKAGVGDISSKELFLQLGFSNWESKQKEYLDNFLTLDSGFRPFAEKLYGRYKMALLSNDVSEWSAYLTEKYDLNRYYDTKIISGDVSYKKPDVKIYEIAIDRLGHPAKQCLFIDNSGKNLLAAREAGMQTILFNRDGEEDDGTAVNSFAELAKYMNI